MQKLIKFWEEQTWVDQVSEKVKSRIDKALENTGDKQKVADFLNGVWLGHPLHPVLTDIPLGAWATAAVFDVAASLTGRQSKAAMSAIGLGIAAAVPTAAAGAMDWYHLNGRQQRMGAGHGIMNSAGLLCYILSFTMRMTGLGTGRSWAFLGLGIAGAASYIGGHLVFVERIGVRRASEEELEQTFLPAGRVTEVEDGGPRRINVDGVPVLVARANGQLYAVADTCTHLACSLAEGTIAGDAVICDCHGSKFSLNDGSVLQGPATAPLATYDVRTQDGRLEVKARSGV